MLKLSEREKSRTYVGYRVVLTGNAVHTHLHTEHALKQQADGGSRGMHQRGTERVYPFLSPPVFLTLSTRYLYNQDKSTKEANAGGGGGCYLQGFCHAGRCHQGGTWAATRALAKTGTSERVLGFAPGRGGPAAVGSEPTLRTRYSLL